MANRRKLEDIVNLLNLNPDRYISPVISKGPDQKTLALNYNVYEANPWHYFVQVDNSGTDDRQWAPRIGLINTNLLGFDDRLTVFHQSRWDSEMDDEYSIYGSYDFPIMGPKLRLDLFGGYSKFDVQGGGGIDFIGKGKVYGGRLRYNVFQKDGWFYDLTTSLSREDSEVTTNIFSAVLGSKVKMDLWGIGANIHRRNDMKNTSVAYDYIRRVGGSGQDKYWDSGSGTGARTNAEKDFAIHAVTANHSQYLKADKVQRLTGSLRWIIPEERLIPAKMTTFGGMYSVRGYKENRIVADGGVLASAQYEYDLVKADQAKDVSQAGFETKPWLRKLAPLAFFDYGRTDIKDRVAGEDGDQELYSVGLGAIVEIGDNFSGAVYYGFPLESTDTTDSGDGRLNISLMLRW
ncbi:MAG: ShlB/FhaC/HecB family hemolysin secretion/activation protein [Planctomycetota bacterium]